jgi:hypothetical protein
VSSEIYTGVDSANFMGVPFADPRVPDVIGIAQYGTVYTGGTKKIAEHGGDNPQDRNVPIIVSGNPVTDAAGKVSDTPVETTQIAPTILQLLGLDPSGAPSSSDRTHRRASARLLGHSRIARGESRRAFPATSPNKGRGSPARRGGSRTMSTMSFRKPYPPDFRREGIERIRSSGRRQTRRQM